MPIARAIDGQRLWADLQRLAVPRAATGLEHERAGLADAEDWLAQRLEGMGYTVERQAFEADLSRFVDGAPTTWHNLIVEVPGSDRPDEVVLFGAHFDTVPGSPGADDNASGVAALLAIADGLRGRAPARTIRLVFFNLEEVGLLGSRAYASAWLARSRAGSPERIVAMATLEMLGYYSDEPDSQRSPVGEIPGVFTPPTVGDFLSIVAIQRDTGVAQQIESAMQEAEPTLPLLRFDVLPIPMPDMLRSDHAPFLGLGVPAVMITDTSEFRYGHYHLPTDTPDRLDRVRFERAARAVAAAAWSLAHPEGAPVESN